MENTELKIYGKEDLIKVCKGELNAKLLAQSIKNYFENKSSKVNLKSINNELLIAEGNNDNGEMITRIYKSDRTYMDINPEQNILSIMENNSNFNKAEEVIPEFWNQYVKYLPGYAIPTKLLKMIQDYIFTHTNVLLKGGPGTGKTELPQRLAKQLGIPYIIIDCGTIKTPQDWFGTREYVEGEGTKFIPSLMVEYLQKPSIVILDEINRTTPDCHNSIFRALDENREIHITALKKIIKVHPQCIIMATMNEGRSHTGTFTMDSAIDDRFESFTLSIPTQNQIIKILNGRFPDVAPQFLEPIAKVTHQMVKLYDDEMISKEVGMRPAISACKLLSKNNKLEDVLEQTFVNRFSMEGGIDSEAIVVRQAIQGLLTKEILKAKNSDFISNPDNNLINDEDEDEDEIDDERLKEIG